MKASNSRPVRVDIAPAPCAGLDSINAMLEPELLEVAADWGTKKRLAMAAKFKRWANQLAASEANEKPAPKIPKGFVMVNLAMPQQKELRSLARGCGVDLRDVLRWALNKVRTELKARADIKQKTGMSWGELDRRLSPRPERN